MPQISTLPAPSTTIRELDTDELHNAVVAELDQCLVHTLSELVYDYAHRCAHDCDVRRRGLKCCWCADKRPHESDGLVVGVVYVDGWGDSVPPIRLLLPSLQGYDTTGITLG
jgi:hypothetical protein